LCSGVLDIPTVIYGVIRLHTTTTCRQLGNDTTYDTEKKNPTSHDVADTSAVPGRRVGKTRHHVVKTNCGRHLKRRHFQLRQSWDNLCASKELIHLSAPPFCVLDAFLSTGNIVGVTIFTGEVYGVTIFATVTKFEITLLEVSKLQK